MTVSRFTAGWLALALVALVSSAAAQDVADTATARALAGEGYEAMKAGACAVAADRFSRAEELHHAPTLLLGLARANVCLNKLVAAQEMYNRIIREPLDAKASPAFVRAHEDATREVAGLAERIAWVTIEVEGPDKPEVTLDGKTLRAATLGVRRAVDPGEHTVKASAPGFAPAEQTFTLAAGGSDSITLTLDAVADAPVEPTPEEPAPVAPEPTPDDDEAAGSTQRTLGFVSFGIAGAGVVVGGVMAGLAASSHSELVENCPDDRCPKEQEGTYNDFASFSATSMTGFIAAGAFAVTGLVLVLTAPDEEDSTALTIGPGTLTLSGSF